MDNGKGPHKLMTISEIAKTCGVTKHTLMHYDEIGLLKPEFVNDKGYRFYSLKQCYTLDMINTLKKAGSSLQEIALFFSNPNKTMLAQLIRQKKKELELEMLKMKRVGRLLEDTLHYTEENGEAEDAGPVIREFPDHYFVAVPVQKEDDHEYARSLTRLRALCEEQLIAHEFPIWSITRRENFEAGRYYPNYVANKLIDPDQPGRILKPKGKYVVMLHRGYYDTMSTDSYPVIKAFIQEKGLTVCGDIYEEDLQNYLTEQNSEHFIIRISVPVA